MALAVIHSRAPTGIRAAQVLVECDLGPGLPTFALVGLAETAVKEARDRVRAAIQNSGFEFPSRRIVVNLAPADLPKVQNISQIETGSRYLRIDHDICDQVLENENASRA